MRLWHRFILPILGHFRRRRGELILRSVPGLAGAHVCDLGGSIHFWQQSNLLHVPRRITIVNISESEVHIQGSLPSHVEILIYDGKTIPFPDNSFDVLLSNSVIEHVPLVARQGLVKEMLRVSRRGFVQTPAFEFPVEPHFVAPLIHWLPKSLGRFLVPLTPWGFLSRRSRKIQDAYWNEVNLLDRREMQGYFEGIAIDSERFLGIRKTHFVVW